MEKISWRKLTLAAVTSICVLILCSLAHTSENKNSQGKKVYCCVNGNVDYMTSEQCTKEGGKPFNNKSTALKQCGNSTGQGQSSQQTSKKQVKTSPVHCCVKGGIKKISKKECKKKGGKGYMTGFEAKRKCKKPDVHCCIEGRISSLLEQKCRGKGGKGYASLFEAKRKCKTKEVFCCVQGQVKALPSRQCKDRKGLSYPTAGEAKRKCGWYCDQGRLISSNLIKNGKTNLKLHPTKEKARQECWEQKRKGFCCTPQGVVGMMKAECERPNRFFTSKKTVEAQCLGQKEKVKQVKISELRKNKNNQFRKKLDRQLPVQQPARVQAGVIGRGVKGEEHGILIYQPGSDGDRFLPVPGGRLLIRYTFVSYPDDLPGHISVTLKNADGSREWNLGDEVPERGTDIIKFIPGDIPQESGYTITLRSVDELPGITPRYGVSDPFTIALPTSGGGERCEGCFYFTSPRGGESWEDGSTQTVSWVYTEGDMPASWSVLSTCGGYGSSAAEVSTDRYCDRTTGRCSAPVTIRLPEYLELTESNQWEWDCRIRVGDRATDPAISADSNEITLFRPNIQLLYPETNRRHVFSLGQELAVTWRINGTFPGAVRVKLLRYGSEVETLAVVRANRVGMLWRIGGLLEETGSCERWSALAGSGYQIRIESTEEPDRLNSISAEFEITRPQMTISHPAGGEVLEIDTRYTIMWDPAGIDGTVRIAIQYGDMGRPGDTDTLAINQPNDGSFSWIVGQTGIGRTREPGDHGDMGPGVGTMGGVAPRVGPNARIWVISEQCERIFAISPGDFEVVR